MEKINLELRVTRLIINGHIPLPCSLTEAIHFLGTHDTSSLPLAVLTSPAMGETTGRRSGQSRRKTQARYIRTGARSCASSIPSVSLRTVLVARKNRGVLDRLELAKLTGPNSSRKLQKSRFQLGRLRRARARLLLVQRCLAEGRTGAETCRKVETVLLPFHRLVL